MPVTFLKVEGIIVLLLSEDKILRKPLQIFVMISSNLILPIVFEISEIFSQI